MPPDYGFQTKDYDKYQLIIVQTGILNMRVHNKDIRLEPGSAAILKLGSAFELYSKDGYSGLALIIEDPQVPQLIGDSRAIKASVQVMSTCELMEHYLLTPDMESKRTLKGLSEALIWEVIGQEKKHLERHAEKWAEIAKGVLDVNLATGMCARKALAHLPLCYRQLSRLFKEAYGVSPKQYQVAARIREAKRMLAGRDTSITETAMELGFSSSQHFATQFKEFTGMTPREFTVGL